jgi:YHS domain-containing protein
MQYVPSLGKKEFSSDYEGVIYYFRSKENKVLFDSNPDHYLPQYG